MIVRLLVNFVSVLIALFVVNALFNPGGFNLDQNNIVAVLIFTVVLMLLNAFVKPILELLALPINCMTFGLFSLVISALIFGLAAYLVPGINLPEPKILSTLVGAGIVGLASGLLGAFFNEK